MARSYKYRNVPLFKKRLQYQARILLKDDDDEEGQNSNYPVDAIFDEHVLSSVSVWYSIPFKSFSLSNTSHRNLGAHANGIRKGLIADMMIDECL